MMPCKLLMCLVWLTDIFSGMLSPLRNPAFWSSIAAVIVLSLGEDWLGSASALSLDRMDKGPDSLTDPVPALLAPLSKLTSLGAGLIGVSLSSCITLNCDTRLLCGGSPPPASDISGGASKAAARFLTRALVLDRRDIGSSEMILGLGWCRTPTSMFSAR